MECEVCVSGDVFDVVGVDVCLCELLVDGVVRFDLDLCVVGWCIWWIDFGDDCFVGC